MKLKKNVILYEEFYKVSENVTNSHFIPHNIPIKKI